MSKGLIYIHGKGGNALEAEHYKPLFPDHDVVWFDYKAETPWQARTEFREFFDDFGHEHEDITVVANSIGAYYTMMSLYDRPVRKAYFISPIADMESLILNMMKWEGITEPQLSEKGTCGELSWEYLSWVRNNPVYWPVETAILYGENDNLQSVETIRDFSSRINADVTVMKEGEHWFHTPQQMEFLDNWITERKENRHMKNNIRHEKSCGAVVFTMVGDTLKYLLVHSVNGFWGFPKGHMEYGESEYDTARREIREETGVNVTFIEGFRATDEHPIVRHGKLFSRKQIVYFLASYSDQTPGTNDAEIAEVRLMDYKTAMTLLQYGSLKDILTKANDFLGGTR